MTDSIIPLTEQLIRTLIKSIGFRRFTIALHNALVHGAILEESGCDFEPKDLDQIFDAIQSLSNAAVRIQ